MFHDTNYRSGEVKYSSNPIVKSRLLQSCATGDSHEKTKGDIKGIWENIEGMVDQVLHVKDVKLCGILRLAS